MIKVNLNRVANSTKTIAKGLDSKVAKIDKMIKEKTGAGSDFLGWTTFAATFPQNEINRIAKVAKRIQDNCEYLVVIGIGGSYLGARAAIEAINGIVNESKVKIVYLGNTISPTYTAQVIKKLEGKKIAINVISKSGTTLEPAIAFRLACEVAKKSWGPKKYAKFVIATTDATKGALHQMAFAEGYEEFVIPDDVGGRFSVFTPVGLIPMAVAGIDIERFLSGAKAGIKEYDNPNLSENEAYKYAAVRYVEKNNLHADVEFLITYEPHFVMLTEWWKQLYGESEGKDKKGILPASLCFSTDLHSMGQFCQDGSSVFFQTTITFNDYQDDIAVPQTLLNFDKLNYLAGKPMSLVENIAIQSTMDAHFVEGGRDNIQIVVDRMDAYNLGQLMFFFCKACAMSAYLNGVNPFDQPGVEIYKKRMRNMLVSK